MILHRRFSTGAAFVLLVAVLASVHGPEAREKDPLPSWNDGPTRSAIVGFVEKVTRKGSPDFVPPAERIARGLDAAKANGWTVVDMKNDWKRIYVGPK